MVDERKFDVPAIYRIKVNGCLDQRWCEWFDGLAIAQQANCECTLVGPVTDQAALHGLLCKIRDLGLPIVSLCRMMEGCEGTNQNDAKRL